MREFRPMPTAPKAMRHIGQGDKRGIKRPLNLSHFLKPSHSSQTVSHSQKTENHPPTLVTLKLSSAVRPDAQSA